MTYEILIIGAGAAGLIAGREFAKAGKQVAILEARDRIGGRIYTEHAEGFSIPIEFGAEFIHGKLPHTFAIIEEAGIPVVPVGGRFYRLINGSLNSENDFIEHTGTLEKKLKEVQEDMSLAEFMATYLSEEKYDDLRKTLRGFAEGFDAADTERMSTIAFREEWLNESWEQYRIEGGYIKLMNYLTNECREKGGNIQLSSVVKKIAWKKNSVQVITQDKKKYSARKILITVPLGVLSLDKKERGAISFDPPIPNKIKAVHAMGFGPVIKIILEFKNKFWETSTENSLAGNQGSNVGFVFSDKKIPTWWTQSPSKVPVLTGWLSGPNAKRHEQTSDEEILIEALRSVSDIFAIDPKLLEKELRAWKIYNWLRDAFSRGAYGYASLDLPWAKRELLTSEDNTIFFAGESLAEDSGIGTVEAAFASGLEAAKKMLG